MPVVPPEPPRPKLAELQEEFHERQARDMERAHLRRRRNLRDATLAGAAAGFAAVLVTAGVTRRAIRWHSYLLETILGAVAGRLLVRWHGGPMKGLLLFAGSYFLAFLLRALGLDPSVLFMRGDPTAAAAVQGHVVSLCFLLSAGLAIGHVVQE